MYNRSTDARVGAADEQIRARQEQERQRVVATQRLVTPGEYTFERTKSGTVTTRPATPAEREYPGARSADPNAARPVPGARTEAIAERAQQQAPASYGGGPVQAVRPQVRVTVIQVKPGGGPGGQSAAQRLPQFTPEYYERLAAQHRQTAVQFGNSQYNLQKARGYDLRARMMRAQSAQIGPRLNKGFAPRTKY